jgi:hypothetical protein
MPKTERTYAERKATGFPLMSITMSRAAHDKLEELAAAWKLPKSTVLAKLVLQADVKHMPAD